MVLTRVRHNRWQQHGAAILLVALATGVHHLFPEALGPRLPYLTFYPAVALAALYGGLSPGLLATVLSALSASYFWIEPVGRLGARDYADWLGMGMFVASCAFISAAAGAMRRALEVAGETAAQAKLAMERKRAAEELRDALHRVNLLLDNSPLAVIEWDDDFHITRWTGEAQRVFGWTANEVLGKRIYDLPWVFEDDVPLVNRAMADMLTGESVGTIAKNRNVRKDGSVIHCEWYNSTIHNSTGQLASVLSQVLDVTGRTRLEEELRRYELLAEHSRDIILYMRREDGRILEANTAAVKAYGYTHAELLSMSVHDLRAFDTREQTARQMAEADTRSILFETVHRRKDGSSFPVEVSSQGATIGGMRTLVSVIRDITARKRAEAALSDASDQRRLALEAAELGSWDYRLDSGEVFWDERCRNMFGIAAGDSIGYDAALAYIHPEDRDGVDGAVKDAMAGTAGGAYQHEFRVVWSDGSVHWVSSHGRAYFELEGERRKAVRFIGISMEITERKRAEENLRHTQKLESIGLLAGGIAHDFNNLLVGVVGNAGLAEAMLPQDSPALEFLGHIVEAGERAAHLTRQMLAYAGKGQFVIEAVQLSTLVSETYALIRGSIGKKIELRLQLEPDIPAIESDPVQMQQIFMNLTLNAAEAIGDKAGVIAVTTGETSVGQAYIRDKLQGWDIPRGRHVFLEVCDNGCGMDESTRNRIFDPFFTTKFQGRGLGLAAVAGIVRAHHGAIEVRSAPGAGATFRVLLPAMTARAPVRDTPAPRQADLSGKGTVLVVDDEEIVRQLARSALERTGYEVLLADSGPAAIDVCRSEVSRIRLVILDLSMPGMSGAETLPHLRQLKSDLDVIISSGYSESEALRVFQGTRVSGFIQKPYTVQDLARQVKAVLT